MLGLKWNNKCKPWILILSCMFVFHCLQIQVCYSEQFPKQFQDKGLHNDLCFNLTLTRDRKIRPTAFFVRRVPSCLTVEFTCKTPCWRLTLCHVTHRASGSRLQLACVKRHSFLQQRSAKNRLYYSEPHTVTNGNQLGAGHCDVSGKKVTKRLKYDQNIIITI